MSESRRLVRDEVSRRLHVLTDAVDQLNRTLHTMENPPAAPDADYVFSSDDDDDGSDLRGFIDDEEVTRESDGSGASSEDEIEDDSQITEVSQRSDDEDDDDIPVRVTRSMDRRAAEAGSTSVGAVTQPQLRASTSADSASSGVHVLEHAGNGTINIDDDLPSRENSAERGQRRREPSPIVLPIQLDGNQQPSTSAGHGTHGRPSLPAITVDSSESDSDSSQLNTRRPKRRRVLELDTENDETIVEDKPAVTTTSTADEQVQAEEDDGCHICYEEFTNAGHHRLVSLKCGHFFGKPCIERWIREEGRAASCPTCKTRALLRDIRMHFAQTVKMTDTTELESMRGQNAELNRKIVQLEMELARKEREMEALRRENAASTVPKATLPSTNLRAGKMILLACKKMLLNKDKNISSYARSFDFNGMFFAVGVHIGGTVFQPYAVRRIDWASKEKEFKPCWALPLHSNRSRVVAFSPFESSLVLSGGEDKRAVVHSMGASGQAIRREWRMPQEKPVWSGCWVSENRVALGLQDGRVWEFAVDSPSTEPTKDYTQGIGNMPVIFVACDTASSVLLVASFKKMLAFRNDRVYPLLASNEDHFESIRSVCWDERSLSFVATFSPGGRHPCISHRLYKLEIPDDSHEVRCVEVSSWNTTSVKSSTLWSNALFSIEQSLFSLVFNEDQKRLEAHDWSGKRVDVVLPFSTSMNICSMRPLPSPTGSLERTIALLTESSIYSVSLRIDSSS